MSTIFEQKKKLLKKIKELKRKTRQNQELKENNEFNTTKNQQVKKSNYLIIKSLLFPHEEKKNL